MKFALPHLLWLLLLIPSLVFLAWRSNRKRDQLITRFISARLLPGLTRGLSPARRRLQFILFLLAFACLVLALARPQWGFSWEEARIRGLDIVVAIDTSKSMLATDIAPNRLARAKLAALDLLRVARSDRLGLVAFAGTAFLQCPLTIDEDAFRQTLEALDVNIIPQGGTAIANAIDTALTAFKEGENYKVLVLFSDGEDQDSGAVPAAKKAAASGLRIYTIGIGTPEGELVRVKSPAGGTDFIRDEQGNVWKSRLNEDLLRQVASESEGGFYLPLRGARTIETLYSDALSKLPKTDRQEKLIKRYHERFIWPLALALALLLAEMLLPEAASTRKEGQSVRPSTLSSQPSTPPAKRASRRPLSQAGAALLILLAWSSATKAASPAKALREYHSGNYRDALQDYEQLLKRKTDDPRLNFNAGAAAYRDGHFDDAAKKFSEALNSPDLKLQESAYYNRGNSWFYLGDQQQLDPAKRSEAWKKSLQDFQSALKLNPKDPDAEFNRQFVKKRLEELQQQQQQNQKQNQDNQDQKDNQDQQKQQQANNQQQDQQNKSPQEQQPQSQQQTNQQQQASQQQQQQQQQQAQAQPKDQSQEPKENAAAQPQPGEKKEDQQQAQEAAAPGQMTPEEAKQLLDSQKSDEKMLPPNSGNQPSNPYRPLRDW